MSRASGYDTEETKSAGLANKLLAEKNNPRSQKRPTQPWRGTIAQLPEDGRRIRRR
jgi:hypothetical protein